MPAMDLNEIARKLKQQRNLGVARNGQMMPQDPGNKGDREDLQGMTTLEPKRFFHV